MRMLFAVWAIVVTLALAGCGAQTPPPAIVEEDRPATPEEAQMRREARSLGTKLYAAARRAEASNLDTDQQHVALKPVYNDIEQFIFRRMERYSNRISSITVSYFRPAVQCVIYVKAGEEEELQQLKRDADSIVGRVVENLPIVKYLMVKNENEAVD
ncbi:MAG: hypothetical protein ACK4UN_11940 [Limisphaerales bacterium]